MRFFIFAALAAALMGTPPCFSEPTSARTPPQAANSRLSAAQPVEVIEFFSYGCPHCRDMSLKIHKWEAQQGKSIHLTRVPVTFGRAYWESLARSYFALSDMGVMDQKLDAAIFEALFVKRIDLGKPETMKAWLKEQNVNLARFNAAYRHKNMARRLAAADDLVRNSGLTGIPAIRVNGEFVPEGSADEQLESASKAVEKLRGGK